MTKYIVMIVVLCAVVYANSIHGMFVSDDIAAIVTDPNVGEFSLTGHIASWTNALCYRIAKLRPEPYHAASIALHAANSVLVFLVLLIFFPLTPSFFGALVFATHPVHAEAVSWISGKPYLFLALFVLSSFLCYVRATSEAKVKKMWYALSLFLYANVLFVTSFGIFYPAIIAFYDWLYGRWRRHMKLWSAFIAMVIFWFFVNRFLINFRVSNVQADVGLTGMTNPIYNTAFSFFYHAGLLVWPMKLTLYHEPLSISRFWLGVEIVVLIIMLGFLPLLFRRARPLFFSLSIYIFFLTPTYSPIMISSLVAERYLYLPSIILSFLVAFLYQRMKSEKAKERATIILILFIALYSIRTIERNHDWRTPSNLWRATVAVSPNSARAHNNMGDVYCNEGDLEKAANEFWMATQSKPGYADAFHNLANTYQKMERINEAILNYKKAIAFNPRLYQSYQNLGVIYFNKGEKRLAREYLKKALEINPDNYQLRRILEELEE